MEKEAGESDKCQDQRRKERSRAGDEIKKHMNENDLPGLLRFLDVLFSFLLPCAYFFICDIS